MPKLPSDLKKAWVSCHATGPRADGDKAYPVCDKGTKKRKVHTTRYATACEKIFKQYH